MGMPAQPGMGDQIMQELMRRRTAANKQMGLPDGGISNEEFDALDFQDGSETPEDMALGEAAARKLNDEATNQMLQEQSAAQSGQMSSFLPPGVAQLIQKYSVLNQMQQMQPPQG